MVKSRIINWKVDSEKIILVVQIEVENQPAIEVEAELPMEIAKEIVTEMPPSEATRIHELIEQIHVIIKERNLTYERIEKDITDLMKENEDAVKAMKACNDKLEVMKCTGVIKALGIRKQLFTERRHTIRLLLHEEANLRLKFREIQLGKSAE
jgi:hypothetical protein